MNNTVKEIAYALMGYDEITIISHIRPDGDTLGSAYALKHALDKLNKHVQVVCESPISPRYTFLSDGVTDISNECLGNIVCVDVASPDMAGQKYIEYAKNADIVIDHHATNCGYGKMNLIDPQAAACGEIILEVIGALCEIDRVIADCIYTAISTDTGCFVYANTTANTHITASKVIEAGADFTNLNKLLFRTKSHAAFEIERRALDSLEYFYNGKVTCMKIALEWIHELNACEDDMESLSSVPAQISGIKAAATFRQIDDNTYKVSVRTNGEIDGGAICKLYGGGGHKMAAGCTLKGDYDKLKSELAEKLFKGN